MDKPDWTETGTAVAREVPCSPPLVRLYAELGFIEYRKASNGVRLYRPGTAAVVREIRAKRLANRGGDRRTA